MLGVFSITLMTLALLRKHSSRVLCVQEMHGESAHAKILSYRLSRTKFYNFNNNNLPERYIVIGDLNAHSTLWGDCDARGCLIENYLFPLMHACL